MLYQSEARSVRIALTGDALVNRPLSLFTEPDYLALVDLLRGADATVTNAETLFHDYEPSPAFIGGGTYMRSSPKIIDELRWMGVSMIATANNHAYDFGEAGVVENLENLEAAGVVHAGTGRTMAAAREPKYLDTPGGRVALVSLTTSGPQAMYAQDQWRDGRGRPGVNLIRYTHRYTVPREAFDSLRRMREEFELHPRFGFMDHSYGASAMEETDHQFFLGDLHDAMQYPAPNGYQIALGDGYKKSMTPVDEDMTAVIERVRDARRMADWVVVSIHNHERGATLEDPSALMIGIARSMIDAGADVVHGHGPHRNRGIEIYAGKPIFYSLGNFIFHNDTVTQIQLDNVKRQGLDAWETTPADFYDSRSGAESSGSWTPNRMADGRLTSAYGGLKEAWQDVVPVIRFESGGLAEVALRPVDLGFQRPRSQRGRPVLASGQAAQDVLDLLSRLSEPFGTKIRRDGDVGYVVL